MISIFIFLIIVLISNIIQTITGFAGTMLAMPFSIKLIGFSESRYLLNLMGIVVSTFVFLKDYNLIKWKKIFLIIVFMTIGIGIAKLIFDIFETKYLLYFYGVTIILVSIYQLLGRKIILNPLLEKILLLLAGFIHGLFVSGGSLLVIYAINVFADKREFRVNLSLVWIILNTILCFMFRNDFAKINIKLIILTTFATSLGIVIGCKILPHIDNKLFGKIANILLLISGISLFL